MGGGKPGISLEDEVDGWSNNLVLLFFGTRKYRRNYPDSDILSHVRLHNDDLDCDFHSF